MATDNKEFDARAKMLSDEVGQMPLVFRMNGCNFRWKVFQMAYEISHPKSLEKIIQISNDIIDYVNNEQKGNYIRVRPQK